jgi:molecular chaperone IbpA
MKNLDYATLYRSTVGFDRLVQLLDAANGPQAAATYPPYNIERLDDLTYQITLAVAGFTPAELTIDVKENALTVRGQKSPETSERHYLHRGIGERAFERRFQLADYVEVAKANLADGLLHIELVRNLPERMKPRTIAIGTSGQTQTVSAAVAPAPKQIGPTSN